MATLVLSKPKENVLVLSKPKENILVLSKPSTTEKPQESFLRFCAGEFRYPREKALFPEKEPIFSEQLAEDIGRAGFPKTGATVGTIAGTLLPETPLEAVLYGYTSFLGEPISGISKFIGKRLTSKFPKISKFLTKPLLEKAEKELPLYPVRLSERLLIRERFLKQRKYIEGQKDDEFYKIFEVPTAVKPSADLFEKEVVKEEYVGNIRIDKYKDAKVREGFRKIGAEHPEILEQGKISNETLVKMARETEDTPFVRWVKENKPGELGAEVYRLREQDAESLVQFLANDIKQVADEIVEVLAVRKTAELSKVSTELGRGVQQFKIPIDKQAQINELLNSKIDAIAKDSKLTKQGKDIAINALKGLRKDIVDPEFNPTMYDKILEFWINSILSHPITHFVNMSSNTVFALSKPFERFGEAIVDLAIFPFTKQRTTFFGEVPQMVKGAVKFFTGKERLVSIPSGSKIETQRRMGAISGKIGEVVRTPGKVLEIEDVYAKQLNGMMETYAQSYKKAAQEKLTGSAFEQRKNDLILKANMLKSGKSAIMPGEEIGKAVQEEELLRTFQTETGRIGKAFMNLRKNLPIPFDFTIPFIRVATNIFKEGFKRSIFGGVNATKTLIETLKKTEKITPEEQIKLAKDISNFGYGTLLTLGAVLAARKGMLIGESPKDESERKQFFEEGKQQNSFKIGNRYIPLRFFEPFGIHLSAVADMTDAAERNKKAPADEQILSVFGSAVKSMTNKSFMTGALLFSNAMTDPERFASRYFTGIASGFTTPGIARFVTEQTDKTLRRHEGVERLYAGLPFLSETVPERLGLFGKPIEKTANRFERFLRISKETDNPVVKELERLDYTPNLISERMLGEKLTREQQDKALKIAGDIFLTRVSNVIKNETWKDKPDRGKKVVLDKIESMANEIGRNSIRKEVIWQKRKKNTLSLSGL